MKVARKYEKIGDTTGILYDDAGHVTNYYGYKRSSIKTCLFIIACVGTAGFLLLVCYWKPKWSLLMTHQSCSLLDATMVLLIDDYECVYIENVFTSQHDFKFYNKKFNEIDCAAQGYKFFWHKHIKHVLHQHNEVFFPLNGIDNSETFYSIHQRSSGITSDERKEALSWFGTNIIDVKVKSYLQLFFEEWGNPFYIFQIFSCILWFSDDYYYYAGAIITISLVSVLVSIFELKRQMINLRDMISKSSTVSVLNRNGDISSLSSDQLVPGDVLVLSTKSPSLYCDAALINGNVVVNESMLTGESVPVTKTPLLHPKETTSANNKHFDTMKQKQSTLFCGTTILQTRCLNDGPALGVVIKTGFTTMKGDLIRSILFPKPVDFKFFSDALKFVGFLAFLAFIGFGYSIFLFLSIGSSFGHIIKKALDVITIAVPPALPAAMSVGTMFALKRLKEQNIFCISPSRINISGNLNLFCFDKTGTLTEDGLDFYGVLRAIGADFNKLESKLVCTENDNMLIAMATCHSLTIINGELVGDVLDVKMFSATGWEIEEATLEGGSSLLVVRPKVEPLVQNDFFESVKVDIIKQFMFSSDLQRMGVVTKQFNSKKMHFYMKGSPEKVVSFCLDETVPSTFNEYLTSTAKKGYRVIALAWKELPVDLKVEDVDRNLAECNLHFLGFMVFKNILKPQTNSVIRQLYIANIRVVMVTGDNILTAISIARESGIVPSSHQIITVTLAKEKGQDRLSFKYECGLDELCQKTVHKCLFLKRTYHLAVTGDVFAIIEQSYPRLYERLLVCGTIFARMLPDQKTSLIEGLQSLDYKVGMCGDGANDCGALKRAHAGISLSEAEASVASPFTSKQQDIGCVLQVMKEGRCALVTSFNIFKFMALYSMIQYCSVLMLYSISSNLGDLQFLYIDLFIITPFAITMGWTGPTHYLSPRQPLGRLMHPTLLISLIAQIFTQIGFQILCFFYIKTAPFYRDVDHFKLKSWISGTDIVTNYENTILFSLTSFQYIIVALVFSPGKPYRKSFYKNYSLLTTTIVFVLANCFLAIQPNAYFMKWFELLHINNIYYYLTLFGFIMCNFLLSYIIDYVLLEMDCMKRYEEDKNAPYRRLIQTYRTEPTESDFERFKEVV